MIIGFEIKGYRCFIDDTDADLLVSRWSIREDGYVAYLYRSTGGSRNGKAAYHLLHRVIMGRMLGRELSSLEMVDHRDRDGLNNSRSNLRIATRSQNFANRKRQKNNTTGFKGVTRCPNGKRFYAQIQVNNRNIYLGTYDTAEEAHAAYLAAAKAYFGEFARGE